MNDVIELPDGWRPPAGTLEPLLDHPDPKWFTIMNFVCTALKEAGCDDSVLISYRDQAMASDFGHLVRCSAAFMGELELEHDSPMFV